MSTNLQDNFAIQTALPLDNREKVADITARNNLSSLIRWEGMTVFVDSDKKTYQLQGGITNANWKVYGAGGGGFVVVADTAARLAIPSGERYDGLPVYQVDTGITWQLKGGITDADWKLLVDNHYNSQAVTTASTLTVKANVPLQIIQLTAVASVSLSSTAFGNTAATSGAIVMVLGPTNGYTVTIPASNATYAVNETGVVLAYGEYAQYVYSASASKWLLISTNVSTSNLTSRNFFKNGTAENVSDMQLKLSTTTNNSLTITNSDPLDGKASYLWEKTATQSNTNNDISSFDYKTITIPKAYRGRRVRLRFDYELSNNTTQQHNHFFVRLNCTGTGSVSIPTGITKSYLYDTNRGRFEAYFKAADDAGAEYVWLLFCETDVTPSELWKMKVDNLIIEPAEEIVASPITAWKPYTPTFQGLGTPTNVEFEWRQNGENIEVRGTLTTGTSTSVEFRLGLPNNHVVGSNISVNSVVGISTVPSSSGSGFANSATLIASGGDNFIGIPLGGTANPLSGRNTGSSVFSSGWKASFYFSVKCAGLGAVTRASDGYDGRDVSCRMKSTIQTNTTWQLLTYIPSDIAFDEVGMVNANGTITVKTNGKYSIMAKASDNTSGSGYVSYFKLELTRNGVTTIIASDDESGTNRRSVVILGDFQLFVGDVLKFYHSNSISYSNIDATISIHKIQSPQVITWGETIAASYWVPAIINASPTVPVNFSSKDIDTHNAVTPSTSAWKFTAPADGIYSVGTANIYPSSGQINWYIYKNGSSYKNIGFSYTGYGVTPEASVLIELKKGDYIDIRPSASVNISGGAIATQAFISSISIYRIR